MNKSKIKYYVSALIVLIVLASCSFQPDSITSLEGSWQFRLDPKNIGLESDWKTMDFEDRIDLPGTTDEAEYGFQTTDTAFGILSRSHEYVGAAWYSRTISIPDKWENKEVILLLERVLWESQVFVDGVFIGKQDGLGTPHRHNLGQLSVGDHKLSLRINNDMIHNIGDKGHAYGEYMQSIWNGVVGKIELQVRNPIHIKQIRTFPEPAYNRLRVEIHTKNPGGEELNYLVKIREKESGRIIHSLEHQTNLEVFEISMAPENEVKAWSEFNPFMYELVVKIISDKQSDESVSSFGFISIGKNQHHVLINNDPVFLRGNLDCIHFPLTGYPAMEVKEWKKIFEVYKDYGLNHVRFHSWCPPDAAFTAADELGIYIQAEASVWIDWWMGTDMVARGRPEMDTKGYPQGIGRGDSDADAFIRAEMQRVIDCYGNHPSFILFCIGNELGSSDFELMGEWIRQLKEYDPRRLYAASTARTISPYCDYSATHNVPGIGGVRQRMYNHNDWDYEDQYRQAKVPIIAHEIGQWPVYPEWSEIKKYKGVLKARSLQQLASVARKNGIHSLDKDFRESSGKLSALLYKDEIESFMRTASCAGYQLLSMQDYIGQGEALIGWLDSFYESKGALSPADARQFISAVVPLIRLPSYSFKSGDTLQTKVQLHQFAHKNLNNQVILWELLDDDNNIMQNGQFHPADYQKGNLYEVGNLIILLPDVVQAKSFSIQLKVNGTEYQNSWPIWIYPKVLAEPESDIIISSRLDKDLINHIQEGNNVLLLAHNMGQTDNHKLSAWRPLYWSASFFPGQSIETLGLTLNPDHPAFASFPTENFGSWNWWTICQNSHGFILDNAPPEYQAIIQPVSDFHYNHRLGSLFETKLGEGKLLICGYNISQERDSLPEVRQLRHSLLQYMASEAFDPKMELDSGLLAELLPHIELASSRAPAGFKNALLYVESAKKQAGPGNSVWEKSQDNIIQQSEVDYSVKCDGTWKDESGTAWFGKKMDIKFSVPQGSDGKLYLYLHDWSNQNRRGQVEIEKRKYEIGPHAGKSKWISLDFMREDTQDGEVSVKIICSGGPNIMITKMAVI